MSRKIILFFWIIKINCHSIVYYICLCCKVDFLSIEIFKWLRILKKRHKKLVKIKSNKSRNYKKIIFNSIRIRNHLKKNFIVKTILFIIEMRLPRVYKTTMIFFFLNIIYLNLTFKNFLEIFQCNFSLILHLSNFN